MSDNDDSPGNQISVETPLDSGQAVAEEFVAELSEERFFNCKGRFTNLLVDSVAFSDPNTGTFDLPLEWQYFVLNGHYPKDSEAKAFWYEVGRPNHDEAFILGFNKGLLNLFAQ